MSWIPYGDMIPGKISGLQRESAVNRKNIMFREVGNTQGRFTFTLSRAQLNLSLTNPNEKTLFHQEPNGRHEDNNRPIPSRKTPPGHRPDILPRR